MSYMCVRWLTQEGKKMASKIEAYECRWDDETGELIIGNKVEPWAGDD